MKIGLGTAHFGLNYGISRERSVTPGSEVRKILEMARQKAVSFIDTAFNYGKSEEAIGRCLPKNHSFKIVTKAPAIKASSISAPAAERVAACFRISLERLRQGCLYGLLIHHADDLLVKGGERLFRVMEQLKAEKLVQKIGVSIYSQKESDAVLERYPIDIIQVPFNIFDQRLLQSGHLSKLKKLNIEIHARSVFLQGLILMDPRRINPFFLPIQAHLREYADRVKKAGLSPLQAALQFILRRPEIDVALVGVKSAREWEEVTSEGKLRHALGDLSEFAFHHETMLNPSLWKLEK